MDGEQPEIIQRRSLIKNLRKLSLKGIGKYKKLTDKDYQKMNQRLSLAFRDFTSNGVVVSMKTIYALQTTQIAKDKWIAIFR